MVIRDSDLKRQRLAYFLPSPAQAGWECRGSDVLPRERSKKLMPLEWSCSFFENWTVVFNLNYPVMLLSST